MKKPFTSVWTRESRPAKSPTLSRDQIVRAAMELLDAEGLDALSMRRLGAKLGSGATSIYWHVANKDDLLDLVMDEVFGKVSVPDPEMSGWREAVTVFAYGLRATFFEHPWSASLIGTRPALGPNAMRLSDQLLKTFQLAGFKDTALDYAAATLMSYVMGVTAPEIAWRAVQASSGMSSEEILTTTKEWVERAARDYPELAARYATYDISEVDVSRALNFEFGLTCMLDGLEAHLNRSAASPAEPATPPSPSSAMPPAGSTTG
ncbi:TetR/AcrR family transcriptional regulator [Streptosporangium sp. NPDC000396]|uniref:TetR/AcrR family transcriptional regulator n=1 Tax=Streptosporangium sp. NPDC000396 TaxID=3366185 RepID=UPI0036C7C8D0